MSETTKPFSDRDASQVLQGSFNDSDKSITVSGFISAKVGHKIERTVSSPTVDLYDFYDGTTLLYTLEVTYNNAAHEEIDKVERIS